MKSLLAQKLEAKVHRAGSPSTGWAAFDRELRACLAAMPVTVVVAAIRRGLGGARQDTPAKADAARYLDGCNIH